KQKKILTSLRAQHCDLAFLQETHLVAQEAVKLRQSWVGSFNSKSRGTAILLCKNLPILIISDYADLEGRYNIIEVKLDGHHMLLVCVYAPNKNDPEFFGRLAGKIREFGDLPMVLGGGDFNEVMDPITDQSKFRHGPVPGARRALQGMLFPNSSLESISDASIGLRLLNDHAPVSLTWAFSNNLANSKRWRINASLLSDKHFAASLHMELKDFLIHNTLSASSKHVLWESLKAFARGCLILLASYLKKIRTAKRTKLEEEILELEKEIMTHQKDHSIPTLSKKIFKLNLLLTQQVEYALFHTHQSF
uniref:Endonuclease/exonuclease/phosphatase domain-containing protein n=1 Tax=Latimeria chalumnae TaxID=7897 RepID=H3AH20_LATCH